MLQLIFSFIEVFLVVDLKNCLVGEVGKVDVITSPEFVLKSVELVEGPPNHLERPVVSLRRDFTAQLKPVHAELLFRLL